MEITSNSTIQKLYIFNLESNTFTATGFQTYSVVDRFAVKNDIVCIYNRDSDTMTFYNIQTLQQLYKIQCQTQVNKIIATKQWQKYDFIIVNTDDILFVQQDFSVKQIKPQQEQLFINRNISDVKINYCDVIESNKYIYVINQDGKTFLFDKIPNLNMLKWQNINEKNDLMQCSYIDEQENQQIIGFTNSLIKVNESEKLTYYGKIKLSEFQNYIDKCTIVAIRHIIVVNERCQVIIFSLQWNEQQDKKKIGGIIIQYQLVLPHLDFNNILSINDNLIYYKQNLQYIKVIETGIKEIFTYQNDILYKINSQNQEQPLNTELTEKKQTQLILQSYSSDTVLCVANITNEKVNNIIVRNQFIIIFEDQNILICRWNQGLLDMIKQLQISQQQEFQFIRYCQCSEDKLYYVYNQQLYRIDNDIECIFNFYNENIDSKQIVDIIVQNNLLYIFIQRKQSLIQIITYNLQNKGIINIQDIPVIPETIRNLHVYKTEQYNIFIFVSDVVVKYYNIITNTFANSQYDYIIDSVQINDTILIQKQNSIDLIQKQTINYDQDNDQIEWLTQNNTQNINQQQTNQQDKNEIKQNQELSEQSSLLSSQEIQQNSESTQSAKVQSDEKVQQKDQNKKDDNQQIIQPLINNFNQNNKPSVTFKQKDLVENILEQQEQNIQIQSPKRYEVNQSTLPLSEPSVIQQNIEQKSQLPTMNMINTQPQNIQQQTQQLCMIIKQSDKQLFNQLQYFEDLTQEEINTLRPQVAKQLKLLNNTIDRIQQLFELDEIDMQRQINKLQKTLLDMTMNKD